MSLSAWTRPRDGPASSASWPGPGRGCRPDCQAGPSHVHGFRRASGRRGGRLRPAVGRTPTALRDLPDLTRDDGVWRVSTAVRRRGWPARCHCGDGPRGRGRQTGHVALLARSAHPLPAQGQALQLRVLRPARLAGTSGPRPRWRTAGRDGRFIASAFPALPSAEGFWLTTFLMCRWTSETKAWRSPAGTPCRATRSGRLEVHGSWT